MHQLEQLRESLHALQGYELPCVVEEQQAHKRNQYEVFARKYMSYDQNGLVSPIDVR